MISRVGLVRDTDMIQLALPENRKFTMQRICVVKNNVSYIHGVVEKVKSQRSKVKRQRQREKGKGQRAKNRQK